MMPRTDPFGNLSIPFSEPAWYSGVPSPYYKASHLKLREVARKWTETHLMDQAHDWEENGSIDHATYQQAAKDGLILPNIGGIRIPKEWAKHAKIIADIPPEEWDGFHAFILQDELMRCGSAGAVGGLFSGMAYGAPLIWKYGSAELREKLMPGLLNGSKRTCITITEPGAGSDVKNLSTTAEKSPDGKYWIINGEKSSLKIFPTIDSYSSILRITLDIIIPFEPPFRHQEV
ncbi:hypothetical protein Pst134EA_032190 [Puccinia striiformis f. sp. tritici]|uniref:uncharacterized protein n=1 Tax=Puccinia striiformis f. sp. tritici TaxID=168172 RepID=UPI00200879FA|nr:uncharacterized protein Pst134EA_032190 [Puccinia striiformis f. sp. tritici]KAH9441855.1 hypothetical protein Pst134EA_032190 [Puccinia striiformis f. sp. tritici]